ncbi:pilus assembly protein, partial [Vibrio cholerae]|uniref:pilus assembly protein n=1 Tax=Vibrio cholerae TaxID=666 RepID=UPI001E5CD68C
MRHSLRTLLAEDWRVKTLNRGVILRMVEARSFGFLEGVEIEVREYPTLEALMQVRLDEEAKLDEAVRPADPVFRISAKLTNQLAYSPLAWFQPAPLRYQRTLVLSKVLVFQYLGKLSFCFR